jgi:hypothetical protein
MKCQNAVYFLCKWRKLFHKLQFVPNWMRFLQNLQQMDAYAGSCVRSSISSLNYLMGLD